MDVAEIVVESDDVHFAHALVIAIPKVSAIVHDERERGRARELGLRVGELEDAREHRVDDDPSAIEVEDEELAAMPHPDEALMCQECLDRLGRAQHERVANADEHDLTTDERLLEPPADDV